MAQYLFDITAIWSVGLAAYYLFFRKEKFHWFNRFYLPIVIIAGIILPTISLPTIIQDAAPITRHINIHNYQQSIEYNPITSQHIHSRPLLSITQILIGIYLIGVALTSMRLAKEITQLVRLYNNSKRYKRDTQIIIETNQPMSPFSLLNYVFINNTDCYSHEELNMLLEHEQRHFKLLHIIDLIIVRISQVVFWFHPLIYLFEKNILLVHEYQADKMQVNRRKYINFLLEQNLLAASPTITHSLTYSPIKNRIMMLQKSTTRPNKYKMLFVIPVFLIAIIMFTNCSNDINVNSDYSVQKTGNTATYKGNTITLNPRKTDTVYHEDGKLTIHQWADELTAFNGNELYTVYQVRSKKQVDEYPQYSGKEEMLGQYLFNNLKEDFEQLEDGKYNMLFSSMVIDSKGQLAYHSYGGIQRFGEILQEGEQPYMASHLDEKVLKLLYNAPQYKPATIGDQAVPCEFTGVWGVGYGHPKSHAYIEVKNHEASIHFKNS